MNKKHLLFLLAVGFNSFVLHAQTYTVPGAQIQPAWVMPLWFENGDGQKDTLYFCYDSQSVSNGYSDDKDSLMGELLIEVDPTKFNMEFEAVGVNDSLKNKVAVNYNLSIALISIFSQNSQLPITLRWDPNLFYNDSLPFPDLDPAPRAEGHLWFDLPTQVDSCSYSVPILMTDTVIGWYVYCHKADSIVFSGLGMSYLSFSVHPWKGIITNTEVLSDQIPIRIHPHVFNDKLIIEYSANESAALFLCDIFGRVMFEQTLADRTTTVHTGLFSSGIYMCYVRTSSNTIFSQMLIKP